ncbi:hypothetical protein COCNU_07G012730 [Cocos nucifera]|uniref:AtC3H23-like CCCH zinc finger domain-containing protein n=1 Tax=Cocos nucifera TaxID=13894 RepID=A0A8K0N5G8_COCNU|nr:hypothetical protein COCNU_07G012730 [Cocos nucifera]
MYEFKVRRCPWERSHDWTGCPYTHPSEKADRWGPRRFHYSDDACPEFRPRSAAMPATSPMGSSRAGSVRTEL